MCICVGPLPPAPKNSPSKLCWDLLLSFSFSTCLNTLLRTALVSTTTTIQNWNFQGCVFDKESIAYISRDGEEGNELVALIHAALILGNSKKFKGKFMCIKLQHFMNFHKP